MTTPFGDERTDELVSAWIDGELDAAARDHGLDPGAARRALEGWDGFPARRDQLAGARAAVRDAPVDRLDDVSRRRLVRAALDRAALEPAPAAAARTGRVLGWVAAVTAAAALVGGGIVLAGRDSTDTALRPAGGPVDAETDSAERAPSPPPVEEFAGDLGDVSDPAGLRARVEDLAARRYSAATTSPSELEPPAAPAAPEDDEGAAAADAHAVPPEVTRCRDDFLSASGTDPAAVLATATGTYQGEPAVVIVVARGDAVDTWVLAADDCATLAGQTTPG